MPKLWRHFPAILAAVLLGFAPLAQAAAPLAGTQVPGYYRMQLGQFEVTALFDGAIELDTQLLKNARPADLQRLLSRMFVGNPKMQTAVNAYLINTGAHLVLVDAGAAKLFGPTLGYVVQNLKAAGYEPAQVDTVVLTHLHADHFGGLNDANGQPLFPQARILVAQSDNDFWLSQQVADAAPKDAQAFFKMARDSAAPYRASGQWATFGDGEALVPGVRAVKADGHTPGHTAYAIESAGKKLLIWGDLVHAHAVQFARPGVAIEFDIDQKQAIATRRRIMKEMAASKTLVAGMHLPFPGIGHVRADGKDRYSWVPIEYAPLSTTAVDK
ncbi:MAG TPA: MBL fold metallo-hydrolase [Rhodocyclaceae bacterium]|nr:MBL fold metallo-hydrolase [Rhodocyclaceae bacterium]